MGQDYVKYARAKGLSTRRIIFVHVMKNIMIPVVTVMGLEFGSLIGFSVVTETIFAWPGMGKLLIDVGGWDRDIQVLLDGKPVPRARIGAAAPVDPGVHTIVALRAGMVLDSRRVQVAEGALSFLGLGVPAPIPSWGGMIAEGREVLAETPHVSMIPAAVMFMTIISFNLIGDRLRSLTENRASQL